MKFNKYFLLFLIFIFGTTLYAQNKILVFTKTNGFTHPSIEDGINLITTLGNDNGLWTTDNTEDSADFNSSNLSQYSAVIWCNTSGDDLLSEDQQQAFEDYIGNGGGFMGIHAATDTYRDGSWPFYNELVGGIVQTSPNHTDSDYNATLTVVNSHPAVDFLGSTWNKNEEYYYWDINGGYLYPDNINILQVEATGSEDYDRERPIAWYKEYAGGRSFYTALGHNPSDYSDDDDFKRHIEEGIKYVIGNTLGFVRNTPTSDVIAFPNPAQDRVEIHMYKPMDYVSVVDQQGRIIDRIDEPTFNNNSILLDSSGWSRGMYYVCAFDNGQKSVFKLIKQ